MTKIMWIGFKNADDPPFIAWNGITFPLNVAVEVTDEHMIRKARGNQYFSVEEAKHETETKIEEQAKIETQVEPAEETDHSKAEKNSGYSPVKKKSRKRTKPATVAGGIPAPDA